MSGKIYEFGPFRLDPLKRLLTEADRLIVLPGKALEVLSFLIERAPHLTTKEELLATVWTGLAVEENNLTVHVSSLRKALGETPGDHRYIVTVPGRGYQFVAPVRLVEPQLRTSLPDHRIPETPQEDATSAMAQAHDHRSAWKKWLSVAGVAAGLIGVISYVSRSHSPTHIPVDELRELAILPFELVGTEPQEDYLALGLSDALITRLSHVSSLHVRPTDAIVRYRGAAADAIRVGRELGVNMVLTGQIQRGSSGMRVTATLVNAKDDSTAWEGHYEASHAAVFQLEDRISSEVAQQILSRLSGADRQTIRKSYTSSPAANEEYLKGRYYWSQDTEVALRKGLACFEHAVELDAHYSLARAAVAQSYSELVIQGYESPVPALAKARQAAILARENDPSLSDSYAVVGFVDWASDWKWDAAETEFRKAVALNPKSTLSASYYAFELASAGRFEEAVSQLRQVIELDPTSVALISQMAYIELVYQHPAEAESWARQAVDLDTRPLFGKAMLIASLSLEDKHQEAMAEFRKLPGGALNSGEQLAAAYVALACARAGHIQDARGILKLVLLNQNKRYLDPYLLAAMAESGGDLTGELRWLNKALETRSMSMVLLGVEPFFGALRGKEPLTRIESQMGLPFTR
jgi:DNA-binding winged helix-turn-helix (wHTH) protein/TolB-like protein